MCIGRPVSLVLGIAVIVCGLAFCTQVYAQQLCRANLHVHTQVSNEKRTYDLLDTPLVKWFGCLDHEFTEMPSDTLASADDIGLDVVGLSDHGGSITSMYLAQDHILTPGVLVTEHLLPPAEIA